MLFLKVKKMARLISSALVLLGLLLTPAYSQDVWPPNGSQLYGLSPTISFRWPGKAKEPYYVQIFASRAEIFAQEVKGNKLEIPLQPGRRYRWQVSRSSGAGYSKVMPLQAFHLKSELVFNFRGKNGEAGRNGPIAHSEGANGEHGEDGANGQNGPAVTVELEQHRDAVGIILQGPLTTQRFFLLPGSAITVDTSGGDGGDGGDGGHGGPGLYFRNDRQGTQIPYSLPGDGGDGGYGGNGGAGGRVVIRSRGVDSQSIVQIRNLGGLGGRAGAPGKPGPFNQVLNQRVSSRQRDYSYNGRNRSSGGPGRPGEAGRPGPDGDIQE